jgi:hypothetical protein
MLFLQQCSSLMSNHQAPDSRSEGSQANRSYDPLRSSWKESSEFNRAWLNSKESLRTVQRVGFVIISMIFLGGGTFWANACWVTFHEGQVADGKFFWGYFFGVAALAFFFLGCAGLKNAFKRNHQ